MSAKKFTDHCEFSQETLASVAIPIQSNNYWLLTSDCVWIVFDPQVHIWNWALQRSRRASGNPWQVRVLNHADTLWSTWHVLPHCSGGQVGVYYIKVKQIYMHQTFFKAILAALRDASNPKEKMYQMCRSLSVSAQWLRRVWTGLICGNIATRNNAFLGRSMWFS